MAPSNLHRTISAIPWRHENGAKWRSLPADLGPWWTAAQTFIRWACLGVWERLLALVQERRLALGIAFLDGTIAQALIAIRWRGLGSKSDFQDMQLSSVPILLSMGGEEQRALVTA